MQIQTVHQEPELAVDRCLGVQRWDFDPMLVEAEASLTKRPHQAGPTSLAVSEVWTRQWTCAFQARTSAAWAKPHQVHHSWSQSRLGIPTPGQG